MDIRKQVHRDALFEITVLHVEELFTLDTGRIIHQDVNFGVLLNYLCPHSLDFTLLTQVCLREANRLFVQLQESLSLAQVVSDIDENHPDTPFDTSLEQLPGEPKSDPLGPSSDNYDTGIIDCERLLPRPP